MPLYHNIITYHQRLNSFSTSVAIERILILNWQWKAVFHNSCCAMQTLTVSGFGSKILCINIFAPTGNQGGHENSALSIWKKEKKNTEKTLHQVSQKNKIVKKEQNITRTWTSHKPCWWTRASFGRSWGADLVQWEEPSQPPSTGQTSNAHNKTPPRKNY